MLTAQSLGLLIDKDADGALGQAGGGSGGDLLHGGEVEGARLRAEASGHDFAPLRGEFADLSQLLLRRFTLCHDPPALRLAPINDDALAFSLYRPVVGPAKCVLASWRTRPGKPS
jgi:hypothetical protein